MQTLQEWLDHHRHIIKHDPDVSSEHHEKALRIIEDVQDEILKHAETLQERFEQVAERIINEKE